MLTDIEPGCYFSYTVTTFGDLFDSFDSEFFGEPCWLVHKHLFDLLKLRLSGVYKPGAIQLSSRAGMRAFIAANDQTRYFFRLEAWRITSTVN